MSRLRRYGSVFVVRVGVRVSDDDVASSKGVPSNRRIVMLCQYRLFKQLLRWLQVLLIYGNELLGVRRKWKVLHLQHRLLRLSWRMFARADRPGRG